MEVAEAERQQCGVQSGNQAVGDGGEEGAVFVDVAIRGGHGKEVCTVDCQ